MGVKVVTLPNLSRALEDFGRALPDVGLRACRAAAEESRVPVLLSTRQTQPYPYVDTGRYAAAWTVVKQPDGAELVNASEHAPVGEWGAKPFMPSAEGIENIAHWWLRKSRGAARRKKDAERRKAAGAGGKGEGKAAAGTDKKTAQRHGAKVKARRYKRVGSKQMKEARRVAFAIAGKFRKQGIPAKHIVGRAWGRIAWITDRAIDRELRREADRRSQGKMQFTVTRHR